MRLYHDVLTNGYYTTRLWIGTPPQMFALIMDTGSGDKGHLIGTPPPQIRSRGVEAGANIGCSLFDVYTNKTLDMIKGFLFGFVIGGFCWYFCFFGGFDVQLH